MPFTMAAPNGRQEWINLAKEAIKKLIQPEHSAEVVMVDIEPELGFTTVVLVVDKDRVIVGNAKRMNYAQAADQQDDEVGINIAVSRALIRVSVHNRRGPVVADGKVRYFK